MFSLKDLLANYRIFHRSLQIDKNHFKMLYKRKERVAHVLTLPYLFL
jgi:hypothetical protein